MIWGGGETIKLTFMWDSDGEQPLIKGFWFMRNLVA